MNYIKSLELQIRLYEMLLKYGNKPILIRIGNEVRIIKLRHLQEVAHINVIVLGDSSIKIDNNFEVMGEVKVNNRVGRYDLIDELLIDAETVNILKDNNVKTIDDLLQKTEGNLMRMRNLGRKKILGIMAALDITGYKLPEEPEEF